MTESAVPPVASATVVDRPWLPFEELVYAHWEWRQDRNPSAESAYRAKLGAFEEEFGDIVNSYWCTEKPSAVALTEQSRRVRPAKLRFHRVSDWATKNEPDVAALLHKCDELAIKIARILHGPTRRIVMRLVVSSATHLMSLVDEPAEHRLREDRKQALEQERVELERAERYYDEVGLRQAQLVYLAAMLLIGTPAILAFAAGIWAITGRDFGNRLVLAILLGAAGAVLSVMSRMADRDKTFQLDYELGLLPLVVLGALRPLLGTAFGLVVYAAIASGLLNLSLAKGKTETETATYFYALLSFAAGWSERLAKDVLDAADKTVGAAVRDKPTKS